MDSRKCCEYHHALDEGAYTPEVRSYRCCPMNGYVPERDPRKLEYREQLGCWVGTKFGIDRHLTHYREYERPAALCFGAATRHGDAPEDWECAAIHAVASRKREVKW